MLFLGREVLRRKRGRRVWGEPAYAAYLAWCEKSGVRAVEADDFAARFLAACKAGGIALGNEAGSEYLQDVELAA